ncbi:axotactin-like isoform X1 [Branchiostoma floridae x Branchiostoma japonicum]
MLKTVVASLVMVTCFLKTSFGQNRDVGSEVTFTNLDGSFVEYLPVWLPDSPQGVRLDFRTNQPDALLIYHEYTTEEDGDPPYVIFVQVEDGRIEINHIYLNWKETVRLGRGLMEDTWHTVAYRKDPATRVLTLTVDGETDTIPLRTDVDGILDRGPPASTTAVYLGGLPDGHAHRHHVLSRYSQFVGCMRNVQFLLDGSNRTLTPVRQVGIQNSCIDRCQDNTVCQHGGACVNQYYRTTCDCYGTGYEGQFCEKSETTEVLLRGNNYVEFVQQNEVDRLVNRISLQFKTQQQTGTLFFGFGLHPTRNYIMGSVQHGYAVFTIDFGDSPMSLTSAARVDDNRWHTLELMHSGPEVSMVVDSAPAQTLRSDGVSFHLRIERGYFGSVGDHRQLIGIDTVTNMIGCMRTVYWNQVSVLEHLNDHMVSHIGGVPDLTCRDQDPIVPFTFPTSDTYLSIQRWDPRNVRLSFRFRTLRHFGILIFAPIEIDDVPGKGIWVRLRDGQVHLEVGSSRSDDLTTPIASMPYLSTPGTDVLVVGEGPLNDDAWHKVQVAFVANHAMLEVDGKRVDRDLDGYFTRRGAIHMGAGEHDHGIGFVGCIKGIKFNGDDLDVLRMMTTSDNHGVIMDNCNIRDFCGRANRCQHGSLCQQDWYRSWCVCAGTGYEGNVCSFPLYKSSCDEYYQMGERRTGVWRIDVDGRGPLPPSYVHCTMEATEDDRDAGTTTITHNLAPRTVVRRADMSDTLLHVTYQDMDQYGQTLLHLLQMSQSCQQWVEYQCRAAPLRLGVNTWFYGAKEIQYSAIGHSGNSSATDGKCSCWYSSTCAEENLGCNCDKGDETWRTDSGYIRDTAHLPIIDAVLLQGGNTAGTEGRLSLGPLQCTGSKTNDPSYGVTFTKESSYIELDRGWEEGDLTFSFITYNTSCILLYQQPSATNPNYLLIYMMNGRSVVFLFRVDDIFENITMISERLLSTGEVQTISVEFEELQVRFTVNMDSRIYDIDRLESFNGFTGPLVLGALPNSMAVVNLEARTGMVGCITMIKVNGDLIDLRKYVGDIRRRQSSPGVRTGCRHSCDPNPCLFGGTCVDNWEEYTCACADPTAQSGQHCENNINLDAATFLTEDAFLLFEESQNSVLHAGIRFGFRTVETDFVLIYAHDHVNNFVQFEVRDGLGLSVRFNLGDKVTEVTVMATGISSGEWVDVVMSRSDNYLNIAANKTTKTVFIPVNLLSDYGQNPFPGFSESIKPERPVAPPPQRTRVYVGGVPASMSTSRPGLLGCIRGLKIGENDVKSLASVAEKTDGVTSGCQGKCDAGPCNHGGLCKEQWTAFTCDCNDTSYTGSTCNEDVGSTFSGNTVIHHHANPTVNSYNASLAFVSRQAGVLFHLSSYRSSNAVIISLLSTGQLQLLVDHGSEKDTINTNGSFSDGVRHYIRFQGSRDSVAIQVDDLDEMTSTIPAHVMFNEFDVAQIGGFVKTDTHVHLDHFTNFTGCMAGVEINGLRPLEILFDSKLDSLRNVVTISGQDNRTTCPGVAPRDLDEVFTFPPWNVGPADTETYSAQAQRGGSSAAAVAVSLCAVVVAVTIGVVCIGRRYRRKKRGRRFVPKKGNAAEMEKLSKPEAGYNEADGEYRPKNTSTIKTNGENSVIKDDDEKHQLKHLTFKRLPALRDDPDDSSSDSSPENCRKHPAVYELDDIDEVPELEWDPQGEKARKQEDDYYEDDILALPVVKAIRAVEMYDRQQGGGGQYVHPQSHSTPIKGRGRQGNATVDQTLPDPQVNEDQEGKGTVETPMKSYGHSFV